MTVFNYLNHYKRYKVIPQGDCYFDHKKKKWAIKATTKKTPWKYVWNGAPAVMICPKDLLAIEFDIDDKKLTIKWILDTKFNCEKYNLKYGIYSHNGKSDYLYIRFNKDLDRDLKLLIASKLIPKESKKYFDTSNLGDNPVPIPYAPHWKYGTIHDFIIGVEILNQNNVVPTAWENEYKALQEQQPSQIKVRVSKGFCEKKIKDILSTDFKLQKLIAGDVDSYKTPSESRMALLNLLVGYGLSDHEIYWIMDKSTGLNWHDKNSILHNKEINKARVYNKTKREVFAQ